MGSGTPPRRGKRGSVLIFLTLATPFFVGLCGLGIDATICYIVQTELSAAVDGAALGAGRLLSTNANASDIANEFLNANFRVGKPGFWSSYNLVPAITVTNGVTKTVTVNASVTLPLVFMRLIHQDAATVTATATATRRDARVEFVIDRSGSMSALMPTLITYAQGFTEQFTEGYDELGLVVFSGSGVVAYPTTPWPAPLTYNGGGGPDTSFYSGASTDMVHQIGNLDSGNGTGMGDALALAYIELQKAHMRDMAALGNDTRMSAIVLFTDGVPSAVSVYLNRNGNPVVKAGSGCPQPTDTLTPSNPMYGYVVMTGSPPYASQKAGGFNQLASIDPGNTSAQYVANATLDSVTPPTYASYPTNSYTSSSNNSSTHGCNNTSGWNWSSGTVGNGSTLSNLSALPSKDKYGYNLTPNGNGYKLSAITGDPNATSVYDSTKGGYNPTAANPPSSNAYQWGLAAWDQVDNVAEAIRSDANYANRTGDTVPLAITIYTIGYTGNGGTDWGLLEKIANINGCSVNGYNCYNNTQLAGLYVQASDTTALANAFSTIATAILRLSH